MKKISMTTTKKSIFFGLFFAFATLLNAQSKVITVKTAEEFILAIGPDRTIIVDAKNPLNLTEALEHLVRMKKVKRCDTYFSDGIETQLDYDGYDEEAYEASIMTRLNDTESGYNRDVLDDDIKMRELNNFSKMNLKPEVLKSTEDGIILPHIQYDSNSDGIGLIIRRCDNLTIRAKKGIVTLLVEPRYVNVLEFQMCDNLTLQNLQMGHTLGGYCDNGVLKLVYCHNVLVEGCDLFGCGTEGFIFDYCHGITVNNSSVHDCTYHTLHVRATDYVRFNDCKFYRNREFEQINIGGSNYVYFTGCTFDDLKGELFNMTDYNYFAECVFRNCQMEPVKSDFESQDYAIMHNCTTMFGDTEIPKRAVAKPDFKEGKWTDGKTSFIATKGDDYQLNFVGNDGTGFALTCFSVAKNDYEIHNCRNESLRNEVGLMGAQYVKEDGKYFLRILDDGNELIKSLYYLGK